MSSSSLVFQLILTNSFADYLKTLQLIHRPQGGPGMGMRFAQAAGCTAGGSGHHCHPQWGVHSGARSASGCSRLWASRQQAAALRHAVPTPLLAAAQVLLAAKWLCTPLRRSHARQQRITMLHMRKTQRHRATLYRGKAAAARPWGRLPQGRAAAPGPCCSAHGMTLRPGAPAARLPGEPGSRTRHSCLLPMLASGRTLLNLLLEPAARTPVLRSSYLRRCGGGLSWRLTCGSMARPRVAGSSGGR